MGRRKNQTTKNSNPTSTGFTDLPQGSTTRFEDDGALIDHDESMCDPDLDKAVDDSMGEPEVSFVDANDKTSADYYFDSYSHFGNFSFSY